MRLKTRETRVVYRTVYAIIADLSLCVLAPQTAAIYIIEAAVLISSQQEIAATVMFEFGLRESIAVHASAPGSEWTDWFEYLSVGEKCRIAKN